jgi:uncharacterized repeat protein (TIGR02543 family)
MKTKIIGFCIGWTVALSTAGGAMPQTSAQDRTLQAGQCYTWGINPRITLPLKSGQIITEARVTIHHIRPVGLDSSFTVSPSTPRSELRPGQIPEQRPIDEQTLRLYVLDNPRLGFFPLRRNRQNEDPFAPFGSMLSSVYQDGDLVCRLSQTHDPNHWTVGLFGNRPTVPLTDGTTAALSSAMLEFIDYAGSGVSVGFGICCDEVSYAYDDITLNLTVQSFLGESVYETILCHSTDEVFPDKAFVLTVNAENGSVTLSPEMPFYLYGQTVTLTAEAEDGYIFSGWSGGITAADNPVTLTIDSDKTVTATFTKPSRSGQRGM